MTCMRTDYGSLGAKEQLIDCLTFAERTTAADIFEYINVASVVRGTHKGRCQPGCVRQSLLALIRILATFGSGQQLVNSSLLPKVR